MIENKSRRGRCNFSIERNSLILQYSVLSGETTPARSRHLSSDNIATLASIRSQSKPIFSLFFGNRFVSLH